MTGNNVNLDLVNINPYIKFGKILSICSQDIERKENLSSIQGHTSVTNLQKMRGNNPNPGLVNMNAHITSGGILSIWS